MRIFDALTSAGGGRLSHRQRLLDEIRQAGPIGRAGLAERLGVSVQAASNITEELCRAGLIREAGKQAGGRGQPVMRYALNPDGGFAFGFELRPGALYLSLTDLAGEIRAQRRIPLPRASLTEALAAMEAQIAELRAAFPLKGRLMGAGLVMPGPFGATGIGPSETALEGGDAADLRARIEAALGLSVTIENDATAGACAEHQIGCAQGVEDFAYLYFGTGLGLGVISAGQPMRGAFGNSGEIGHLCLPGRKGVLERHLSRASVRAHLARAGHRAETSEDLSRLFAAGNAALLGWLEEARAALAQTTALIENIFDPATIVLGGAMPGEILAALCADCPLPARSVANRPDRALPRLQLGATGSFTVSVGAAALRRTQFFRPQLRGET